ncbi:universal stress protein [Thalassococcus sp. S3]|uniref:universal stress protein n=1 Tax=Thalassococcus sp. S3 TaxID=2017482 RepID=UPI00102473CB|nr:universal stress protein [Thalassococcus sp. S3]QBF33004.1 hypothetical protein CFI11_17510 [Thalassococcus sp. S3]
MFKNIIVAVDGSDHAIHALGVACDLAKHYESDLHLVHTPELDTVALAVGSGAFSVPPSDEKIAAAGKAVIEMATNAAKDQGVTPTNSFVGNGTPAQEVLSAAERTGADLIVAGRRGLGGVSSLLLGSTSQKIAQTAPCAVLTVK